MVIQGFEKFSEVMGSQTAALLDVFPLLRKLPDWALPLRRYAKELHKKEGELYMTHWLEAKKNIKSGSARPCICVDILRAQDEEHFSDKLAAYTSGSLLEAGSDTTSSTLVGCKCSTRYCIEEFSLSPQSSKQWSYFQRSSRSPRRNSIGSVVIASLLWTMYQTCHIFAVVSKRVCGGCPQAFLVFRTQLSRMMNIWTTRSQKEREYYGMSGRSTWTRNVILIHDVSILQDTSTMTRRPRSLRTTLMPRCAITFSLVQVAAYAKACISLNGHYFSPCQGCSGLSTLRKQETSTAMR